MMTISYASLRCLSRKSLGGFGGEYIFLQSGHGVSRDRTIESEHELQCELVLEPRSSNGMNWAVIWIPFDCFKVWGSRGHLRVRGEINAFQFRSALLPTGD